jgi:hypothetical protein
MSQLRFFEGCGIKLPQTKAATSHRTPKSNLSKRDED